MLGPARSRRGTTMIELMIVMAVVVIAAGIFSRMVIATSKLRQINRENALAADAARVVVEQMRNERFSELFALYNPDPDDDPGGIGTGPGNLFAVERLELLSDSATGFQGEVILPSYLSDEASKLDGTRWEYEKLSGTITAITGLIGGLLKGGGSTEPEPEPEAVWALREDFENEDLGMPRDLNGDSVLDAEDHSEDYILLPVLIRIEWAGGNGDRSYELHTMITDMLRS